MIKILPVIVYGIILFSLSGLKPVPVRQDLAQQDSLIGNWKGTSLCQVKNSPCHDEIAAYHISPGNGANTYQFQMNKIVDGKELEMGAMVYKYDPKLHTFTGRHSP